MIATNSDYAMAHSSIFCVSRITCQLDVVHASIGVARIGNHPGSLPSDYYVGPETPGTVIVPPNGYKDASGRVLRQAARFRIYAWENGIFMGEITSSVADITDRRACQHQSGV